MLQTEREYDGYFCSIKDAVIIVILGSLCDVRFKECKKIHGWATSKHIKAFLEKEFGIKRIPCYRQLLSLLAMVPPESLNRPMKNRLSALVPHLAANLETEEEA